MMDSTAIVTKAQERLFSGLSLAQFSYFILVVSGLLAFFESQGNAFRVGGWDMLVYLLLLVPLIWLIKTKKIANSYTQYAVPLLAILMIDVFYYNNDFAQGLLPSIISIMIVVLYLTSMHEVEYFYQTFLPRFSLPFHFVSYTKMFIRSIFALDVDRSLYKRVGIGLLVTLPVLGLFLALFMSADAHFSEVVKSLFTLKSFIHLDTLFAFVFHFFVYLMLFIYGLSNAMRRTDIPQTQAFDMVIVGIFLGMLNFLFLAFLLFQVPYLFGGEAYIKASGLNIAAYARDGFFQLMWVMGLVMVISLSVMRRFKGEKVVMYLMIGLILQTIVLGVSSLKKMYLYQEIKGVTVLRYYVEWSDYFLLLMLGLGIYYILKKDAFHKYVNSISMLGMLMLVIISSINIDAMVAKHNIEKFKESPYLLDKKAISFLSVDALGAVQKSDIDIVLYHDRDCSSFGEYHFGYCREMKLYGGEHCKIENDFFE